MLYFSPPTSNKQVHQAMFDRELGFIKTPAQGNRLFDNVDWCADNGCFGKGYPGDERWLAWLAKHRYAADRCWFATAPDVVGGGAASLGRSLPWLPRIREAGFKAALVAQDGFEDIEIPWDEFDVLFIGGKKTDKPSDEWKLSEAAHGVALEAKRRGKGLHMGRVSSKKRWDLAYSWNCDSVDGTFIKFGPHIRLPECLGWAKPRNGEGYGGSDSPGDQALPPGVGSPGVHRVMGQVPVPVARGHPQVRGCPPQEQPVQLPGLRCQGYGGDTDQLRRGRYELWSG